MLLLAGVGGVVQVAAASPVTYTLYPLSNGASTLTGSITIDDGPTIGDVFLSEIVDWQFSVTGAVNFTLRKSDAGSVTGCAAVEPCFEISGTELLFDFRPNISDFHNFGVNVPGGGIVLMKNNRSGVGYYGASDPQGLSVNTQPDQLIAVASSNRVTPIAEPSMISLMTAALGTLALVTGRRRRTQQAPKS
jgi:hypothetical protein